MVSFVNIVVFLFMIIIKNNIIIKFGVVLGCVLGKGNGTIFSQP